MSINEDLYKLAEPISCSYEVPRAVYDYVLNNKKKVNIDYFILSIYSDLLPSRLDELLGTNIYNTLVLSIQQGILDFVYLYGDDCKGILLNKIKDKDILTGIKFIFDLTKLDNKSDIINLVSFKVSYWSQLLKDVFSPSLEEMGKGYKESKKKLLNDTLELFNIIRTQTN